MNLIDNYFLIPATGACWDIFDDILIKLVSSNDNRPLYDDFDIREFGI